MARPLFGHTAVLWAGSSWPAPPRPAVTCPIARELSLRQLQPGTYNLQVSIEKESGLTYRERSLSPRSPIALFSRK